MPGTGQSLHPAKCPGLKFISDFTPRWCKYQCTKIYLKGGLLYYRPAILGEPFYILNELAELRAIASLKKS
jgi:hypothetical protein